MSCSSCGSKKSIGNARAPRGVQMQPASFIMSAQPLVAPEGMVEVVYMGPATRHFVQSPAMKVAHYGYRVRGDTLYVHPDDVRVRPDRFVVASIQEALKVWDQYPVGAPDDVVARLGVPDGILGEDPVYVPDDEEIPFSDDPEAPVEQTVSVAAQAIKRIRNRKKGKQ